LMHSDAELADKSLSAQVILRYLEQKHPRGPKVAERRSKIRGQVSPDADPIMPFLVREEERASGITHLLL